MEYVRLDPGAENIFFFFTFAIKDINGMLSEI